MITRVGRILKWLLVICTITSVFSSQGKKELHLQCKRTLCICWRVRLVMSLWYMAKLSLRNEVILNGSELRQVPWKKGSSFRRKRLEVLYLTHKTLSTGGLKIEKWQVASRGWSQALVMPSKTRRRQSWNCSELQSAGSRTSLEENSRSELSNRTPPPRHLECEILSREARWADLDLWLTDLWNNGSGCKPLSLWWLVTQH